VTFAALPNSTVQLVLLFANKVQIGCVMISLLARVRNAGSYKGGSTMVSSGQSTSAGSRSLPVRSYLGAAGESGRALATEGPSAT
jgi:hypothetical protein